MTVTRLTNAIVYDVYGSYMALNNPERSEFFTSGVVTNSDVLNGIARAGGKLAHLPFWNDLDPNSEPNYSNDDPADMAEPENITSGEMTARKSWLNKGYGDMDLVQELAGSSPMQQIRNRFGTYWLRQFNRRLIANAQGVLASNIANNAGDMLVDISTATAPADQLFNRDAFVDATYQMGEYVNNLSAIAVHSDVKARMVKNDDIITVHDSELKISIDTYNGAQVIVDNTLGFTGTGANKIYTSIVFGRGSFGWGTENGHAFAYGEGVPRVAVEVDRNPRAGNGGGMEEIWERKTWLLHPFGFTWNEAATPALVEFSPTLANLREASRWSRVVSRVQVPLAFIRSKA